MTRTLRSGMTGALVLAALGATLPWLTLFRGLRPVPGFAIDGGPLAGLAVASLVALLAASAGTLGRGPARAIAAAGGAAIALDALLVRGRIDAYVADPGPAALLTQPAAGTGALAMAAAGLLIVLIALAAPPDSTAPRNGTAGRVAAVLSGALLLAGWIHLLLAPEHLAELPLLGLGFLAGGVAQVALAVVVAVRPGAGSALAAIAIDAGLLAAYAFAVFVGFPAASGHQAREAVGLLLGAGEPVTWAGAVTVAAEAAALAAAGALLRRAPAGRWSMLGGDASPR